MLSNVILSEYVLEHGTETAFQCTDANTLQVTGVTVLLSLSTPSQFISFLILSISLSLQREESKERWRQREGGIRKRKRDTERGTDPSL